MQQTVNHIIYIGKRYLQTLLLISLIPKGYFLTSMFIVQLVAIPITHCVNSVPLYVRKLHFMYESVRTSSKYRWSIYRTSGKCRGSIYRTSRKRRGTLWVVHKAEQSSPTVNQARSEETVHEWICHSLNADMPLLGRFCGDGCIFYVISVLMRRHLCIVAATRLTFFSSLAHSPNNPKWTRDRSAN